MKFFAVTLSVVLSTSAFAANTTKVKKVKNVKVTQTTYSDGTTSTVRTSVPNRVARSEVVHRVIPQVGVTINDASGKTTGTRTGFAIGALADLLGNTNLVFETGLMYRQQGTTDLGKTFALNYLSVPLSAKYYLYGQQANTPYFKAGLVPAFAVSKSISFEDGSSRDAGNDFNTFDLAGQLAVGGKIAVSKTASLILEANYLKGFTNVVNTPGSDSSTNISFGLMSGVAVEL